MSERTKIEIISVAYDRKRLEILVNEFLSTLECRQIIEVKLVHELLVYVIYKENIKTPESLDTE